MARDVDGERVAAVKRKAKPAPKVNGHKSISHLRDLKPDSRNARKHSPRNVGVIEAALGEVGAARSIVIDESGQILAGNATVEAAGRIGIEKVKVVDADGETLVAVRRSGLTKRQKTRLALLDNAPNAPEANAEYWDGEIIAQLAAEERALLDGVLYDEELAEVTGAEMPLSDAEPQFDRAEELREKWGVRLGQLWCIGEHRLLCGDCTLRENVERVMGGEKAAMVFTDPPYGVNYDGGTKVREKLNGDGSTDLYNPACKMAAVFSDEKSSLYLWHAGIKGIAAAAAAAGYEIRCEIVWNKNLAQYGALSAQYKQKHEPCYYCFKRGHSPRWYGPTNEVTVWDCDRSRINEFHPTQKPIELAMRAMCNSSKQNDIISDWFLSSGTTLVACQNLQRRGRGIEISPGYVGIALERMSNAFPGIEIELVNDGA